MAKVFGIALLVLAVWLGLEIFTKGSDEAFGGLFASGDGGAAQATFEPKASTMQRIGSRVQENMDAGRARSTNGIDDNADEGDDEDE